MREKVVCLISGGIDSPVAAAIASRSFEILPLHFCLYPYTCEDNFFTAVNMMRKLREKVGFEKALIFPWGRVLKFVLKAGGKYSCVLCRSGMFRVAEIVCEREGAAGIVTGESIGQKASQTIWNLSVTSGRIKFPIIRPLLCSDKVEVVEMSKRLGLWQEVHAGCCYATPRHPTTKARKDIVSTIEKKIGLESLISQEFKNILESHDFSEDLRRFLDASA